MMMQVTSLAAAWWQAALAVSLQFAILVLLAGLLVFACRKAGPQVRHTIWLVVMARLLVPAGIQTPVGIADRFPGKIDMRLSDRPAPGSFPAGTGVAGPPTKDSTMGVTDGEPRGQVPPMPSRFGPTLLVFGLWVAGLGSLALLVVGRGLGERRRIRADGLAAPRWLQQRANAMSAEFGIRQVPVIVLPGGALSLGPGVQGVFRPQIVLPSEVLDRAPSELETVLAHELIHLRRRDHWIRAVQTALQIVFFFHPLVWLASHRLSIERELACDDETIRWLGKAPKRYAEVLLQFAVPGPAFLPGHGSLPLVSRRRSLERRLVRLASGRVRPRPSRGRIVAATVLAMLLASIAGTGSQASLQDTSAERNPDLGASSERVRGIITWERFFVGATLEEALQTEARTTTGDLEPGRLAERGITDESVLDADTEGQVWIKSYLGLEGRVLEAEVTKSLIPDVDEMLRQRVLGTRYEPWVLKNHGPVFAEVTFRFRIRPEGALWPEEAAALRFEQAQRPVEGLVATVLGAGGAQGRRAAGKRVTPRTQVPPPSDLPASTDPPSLTFTFGVDEAGIVNQVRSYREPTQATEPSKTLLDALEDWISQHRFEPLAGPDGNPVPFGASLTLQLENGRLQSLVDRDLDGAWEAKFHEVYRLGADRALRLVTEPFIPERTSFLKAAHPTQARAIRRGPDTVMLHWDDELGKATYSGQCFGCRGFPSLLRRLGFEKFAVIAEPEILALEVPADVILRPDAARETLLGDLAEEIRSHFGFDLHLTLKTLPVATIVVRGSVGEVARDPNLGNDRTLHIYRDAKNPDPRFGAGARPAPILEPFLHLLSGALAMPVVDETSSPAFEPFRVKVHRSAQRTADVERVLRNLEAQSDLEFEIEPRPTTILEVAWATRPPDDSP